MSKDIHRVEKKYRYALWGIAGLTFIVGDVATSIIGLYKYGMVEYNSIPNTVLSAAGITGLIMLKVVTIALLYALTKLVPPEWRVGVPVGLIIVGSVVTLWNIHLLYLP